MNKIGVGVGVFLSLWIMMHANLAWAQGSASGIAITLPLGSEVKSGSVLCMKNEGFMPCDEPYALGIYGVVTDQPIAAFETLNQEEGRRVVSSGRVMVRASQKNGTIGIGDMLTSSDISGLAQKATAHGYVIGSALSAYTPVAGDEGLVEVLLNIHLRSGVSNARSNLIEYLRNGLDASLFEPLASLRYVLAALLILLAFVLGFVYFGRMARAGVEAVGRNPLASRMIQLQVAMNVLVLIVVVLAGVFAAYLVLIL